MDILKLGRNTIHNTVPLYKLEIGTPLYLWNTDKPFELDTRASLLSEIGPKKGHVTIIYCNGKTGQYWDKNSVVPTGRKK